jgi:hypothetical protein
MAATVRQSLGEQQPLPPRSNGQTMASNHTQVISNQGSHQQEHSHIESTNV